jgi:hypothetical protein
MMRRHELDPVSLTFGFAFTGLGLLFLLGHADQALRLHWVWPLVLLVVGAGALVALFLWEVGHALFNALLHYVPSSGE